MPSRRVFFCLPLLCAGFLPLAQSAAGAEPAAAAAVVAPNENLVLDNVPPIPAEIAEKAGRYGDYRGAALLDWHQRIGMLIATRFGDTNQVHSVVQARGARTQLTFFPDRVESAVIEPIEAKYFIFHKGAGGAEFFQNYRFDLFSGEITLLTDGKSRNSLPLFSYDGKCIAYTSTRRNGTDTDIYTADPLNPKSEQLLAQVQGGGWEVQDWSTDGKRLLVIESISINESYLWTVDAQTGAKTALTPRAAGGEKVSYRKALFARTRPGSLLERENPIRGIFALTDQGGEFQRLACLDPDTGALEPISETLPFDVEDFALSDGGDKLAYTANEDGYSTLRLLQFKAPKLFQSKVQQGILDVKLDTPSVKLPPSLPKVVLRVTPQSIPPGVITSLKWSTLHPQATTETETLGFNVAGASMPSDVYSFEWNPDKSSGVNNFPARYVVGETGGLPPYSFIEPRLVKWKSFDGREISGFLYQPDEKKFPGKRPVIVNIHGGPESQCRPGFLGRNNFFVNELGCAIIFPNVRGSSGFGKTFLTLDNGFHRDDTYKDIDALLDWIKTQPDLDAGRIMVTGGSYGGHMTLASAAFHADKIRCALDVVGISNLKTFLEHTESYRRDLRRVEYGDERDPKMAEYLERIAPINHAAQITKPLFVVQGANDPRVPKSEAEQIVATLKKNGTPVWYLLAKDEGHGFAKKKNADFQFYATVQFIREYLLSGSK